MESKGRRSGVKIELLAELLTLDFQWIVIAAMDGLCSPLIFPPID